MATKKYFVQHQGSIMHGGRLRTAGDAVNLDPEEAAPYLDKGILSSKPPEAPASAPVPKPTEGLSQQEQDIITALRSFNERLTLLEKQFAALQDAGEDNERLTLLEEQVAALQGSSVDNEDEEDEEPSLTDLGGVGASTEAKLTEAGIASLEALAGADAKALAESTGLPQAKIEAWQQEAGTLLTA